MTILLLKNIYLSKINELRIKISQLVQEKVFHIQQIND